MKKFFSILFIFVFLVSSLCPPFSAEDRNDLSSSERVFSIQKDCWSFVNSRDGFAYPLEYEIPETRYRQIYGDRYLAAAKTPIGTFHSMIDQNCGGSCFGMSLSALLFYFGKLDWNDYNTYDGRTFSSVNEFYGYLNSRRYPSVHSAPDAAVTSLIEVCQLSQFALTFASQNSTSPELFSDFFSGNTDLSGWLLKGVRYDADPEGDYIRQLYDLACNTENPMLVLISYTGMSGNPACHALTLRTDRRPEDMQNGWYRAYVYDPNRPWFPDKYFPSDGRYMWPYTNKEDSYIEFNPAENKWRYSLYGFTNDGSDFVGCDKEGNRKYIEVPDKNTGEIMLSYPEYVMFADVSELEFPDLKEVRDRLWIGAGENQTENKITIAAANDSDFDVYLPDGTPLYMVYSPYMSYYALNDDISVLGDGGAFSRSLNGTVMDFPYTEVLVDYHSGKDFSVMSEDSVINVASDGPAEVFVSMSDHSVRIKSGADNHILAQITDLNYQDTVSSVYADGFLCAGDEIVLKFENGCFEGSEDFSGDSLVHVFLDKKSGNLPQYLTEISSVTETSIIDDVYTGFSGNLRGMVHSSGGFSDPVTLRLFSGETELLSTTSVDGTYCFPDLPCGHYSLEISQPKHFTEIFEIEMKPEDSIQDAVLYMVGDVNGDGEVNSADGTIFARYMAKWSVTLKNRSSADINQDGKIDSADSSLLFRYLAKWNIPYFNEVKK